MLGFASTSRAGISGRRKEPSRSAHGIGGSRLPFHEPESSSIVQFVPSFLRATKGRASPGDSGCETMDYTVMYLRWPSLFDPMIHRDFIIFVSSYELSARTSLSLCFITDFLIHTRPRHSHTLRGLSQAAHLLTTSLLLSLRLPISALHSRNTYILPRYLKVST